MNWFEPIDAYCERMGPGLWAEPLNAVTNLVFMMVALMMWQRVSGVAASKVLCLILFVIGVGSFLFHTFATSWAALADTAPIGIFILTYLYLINRDVVGLRPPMAAAATALFVPFAALAVPVLDLIPFVRISDFYWTVPAMLLAYAFGLRHRAPETARGFVAGAAWLTTSIILRSLDQVLCPVWPIGTHFLWHCLNAAMLGFMILIYTQAILAAREGAR